MAEAKSKADGAPARVFTHDQLIADGLAAFGVPSHVVAAALTYVSKQNLTEDEAQKAINSFSKDT